MSPRVGFDRFIKLRWLDALAAHLLQDAEPDGVRVFLHELLQPDQPADEARRKTVAVLMRMWVAVPPEHQSLRQQALAQMPGADPAERLWFHWGMAILAFPFFQTAAANVGRLLRVQGDVSLAQIQRRLAETLGQRSTLVRACRRVLSSMTEWGALGREGDKGRFRRNPNVPTASSEVQLWLLEAMLRASGAEEIEATQLLSAPELFPFKLTVGVTDLRRSPRFEVHRQGVDMDVIALVRQGTA